MTKASTMIKQALAWLGKQEIDGSFKEIIDTYNSHKPLARGVKLKYTDSWCAAFISALAIKCGATDIIPTECSCGRMIELFKELGVWVENEDRTPSVGEIIFYDWQDDAKKYATTDNKGWPDHVGIVEKVANGKITVIEGNISNKVGRRILEVNGKNIRGYAVPKYEKEATVEAKPLNTSSTAAKPSTSVSTLKAGQAVALSNTPVYGTASTASVASRKTGIFYLWSEEVVGKRVRITNNAAKVGVKGQITGWMNVADIKATEIKPVTYTHKQFIKDIQKAIGAKIDGVAGPETLSKTVTISRYKNAKHAAVKAIQNYLNSMGYLCGDADGIAGKKFDAAIRTYQKDVGCIADGEITEKNKTWKKLLGLS